jgi:hypothetical protein
MGGNNDDRGRGLPSPIEENYTSLCLSLACSLLVHTRDELHVLFKGLAKPKEAQFNSQEIEETIMKVSNQPDQFPAGSVIEIFRSEEVRIEVKRVDFENIEIGYYHASSNALVLTRYAGEGGFALADIDPFFWTLEVDGLPPTEEMMEQLGETRYAFKVDHLNRKIAFKTR